MALLFMLMAGLAAGSDTRPASAEEATEPTERFPAVEWNQRGTHVVWVPNSRAPTGRIILSFPVGRDMDWFEANHGTDALWWASHDTDGALQRRASELAIDVRPSVGRRWSTLGVGFLVEDLEAVREWLGDVLANEDYDRKRLKRARKEAALSYEETRKSPRTQQFRAAFEGLFAEPTDPRVRVYTDQRDVSIDPEHLAATKSQIAALPGRMVGVAGDLNEDQVRSIVDLLPPVATLPDGIEPTYAEPIPRPTRPARQTVELKNLSQVYLLAYRDSPTVTDPDRTALTIANHVLGGHFYSRLYVALRHETGQTYAAAAAARHWHVPMLQYVSTFTRTDNADVAEQTLLETLRRFHQAGITEQERADAVSYFQGRQAFARMNPSQTLSERLRELQLGVPRGDWRRRVEAMSTLSVSEVNAVIARRFDPDSFTLVRVEPR
ncbi:MAG: insulinase family protein [Myxococcota bacterium]